MYVYVDMIHCFGYYEYFIQHMKRETFSTRVIFFVGPYKIQQYKRIQYIYA